MEKKDRYISIGEMAKINRTTVPTLRLYDSMGLLTPYYTDEETHYRYYDKHESGHPYLYMQPALPEVLIQGQDQRWLHPV